MKLDCATCLKSFEKTQKEYNRQIKHGRNEFFCSRTCAAVKNNKDNPRKGNPQLLNSSNRRDEFTPFRWFILRAQYRDCKTDLTVEFLKQLWEEQNGICPLSKWELVLPNNSDGWANSQPNNASIDRIDNAEGYIRGNVRFVAFMANIARQSFSDEQLITFCKAVANK